MPRGRPRKNPEPQASTPMKRGPGRPRKVQPERDESIFVKSAELIGWALGGLEREITQTRDRLSTLTSQAGQLRDRLARSTGIGGASSSTAGSTSEAGQATPGRRRRRRRLSAEQRKAISERMKKRWAERKSKSSR